MSSNIITNSRDPHVGIFEEALVYHHSQDPQGTHFCKHISQWWLLHSESDSGEASQSTASEGQPINSWAPYWGIWVRETRKMPVGWRIWRPSTWAVPRDQSWELQMLSWGEEAGEGVRSWVYVFPSPHPDKFISWMLIPSEAVFGEGTLKDVIKCKWDHSLGALIGCFHFSLVTQSCPDSLRPDGLQHARPPCPSPTPGVYPNSRLLSWW